MTRPSCHCPAWPFPHHTGLECDYYADSADDGDDLDADELAEIMADNRERAGAANAEGRNPWK